VTWTNISGLAVGDTFTINGFYKKRSFWEWLTKKPKRLQNYVVKEHRKGFTEYEATPKD
jgi:hypothetical protein